MKSKIIDALTNLVIGRGKMSITKRINRVMFFICIVLMVSFGFVTFTGIYNSKDYAVEISNAIGNEALETSSDILREEKQKDLLYKIEERTKYIKSEVYDFYADVRILKETADDINQHPENFRPRPVRLGREFQEGDVAALRYAPFISINDLSTEPLRHEIDMLGNLQDLFYYSSLNYRNPDFFDAPTFGILTESGIGIMADSAVTLEQWHNGNDNTDFWGTILYRETKKAWLEGKRNEPIYTSTYSKGINNDLGQFSCSVPYEVNGEFKGIIFFSILMDELAYLVEPATNNSDSINFVLNDEGKVILSSNKSDSGDLKDLRVVYESPPDIRNSQQTELAEIAKKMTAGEKAIEEVIINGNQYYIAYAPIEEFKWSLGVVLQGNEVTKNVEKNRKIIKKLTEENVKTLDQRFINVMLFMLLIVVLLWAVVTVISRKLAIKFVKPIQELSDGVREISSGNMDKKLDIHTGDEIEHLATCFNAMTDELKAYMANLTKVTAEKERIATELDVAAEIQNGMLPKDFPARADFELLATMTPAKEVGGDFYDFYMLDETHLAITVADVSGKGIPAALFMVISKTILNNFATGFYNQNGLAAVVEATNEQLCANNDAMMFVTAFVGVLDLETGEFTFVNGGHNPPVLYRAENNSCEFLDVKKNFVLGPMDGIPFVEQKILLKRGDLLFIYTDGVTEALNTADEEYLPDRLIKFMNSTDCRADLQTLLKNVRADVAEHVNGAEQSDDMTMFALRFNGGDAT